jgi:hypothetical protein
MPNTTGQDHSQMYKWTNSTRTHTPEESTASEVCIWTDPHNHRWQISFDTATRQGRAQPVGLHITAMPDNNSGLTTEVIRAFPMSRIFLEHLRREQRHSPAPLTSIKHKGPRRGAPLDDNVLELVTELYRYAINTGLSPTKHIADEMKIAPSTAAKRIQRARKSGRLKPARPGKPGERDIK